MHDAVDRDSIRPATEKERKRLQAIARNTCTVEARISKHTLIRFKAMAAEKGVPYNMLISSLIEKYVEPPDHKLEKMIKTIKPEHLHPPLI